VFFVLRNFVIGGDLWNAILVKVLNPLPSQPIPTDFYRVHFSLRFAANHTFRCGSAATSIFGLDRFSGRASWQVRDTLPWGRGVRSDPQENRSKARVSQKGFESLLLQWMRPSTTEFARKHFGRGWRGSAMQSGLVCPSLSHG